MANAFVLDLVKLGGHRRDVVDALVRAAVLQANLAHLIRDSELQRRYAGLEQDPPDELRRPASINAIATSLRLPFETVRRRVGGLTEAGICALTPKGVIVPQGATSSPEYRVALQFQYEKLRALYERLRAIDVVQPPEALAPWTGEPPVRLVGRLVVDFVLRFTEPVLEQVPDPVTTLTLLEIILANTEALPDDDGGEEGTGVAAFVPDSRRAPVSVGALRARLAVPNETLRRHVKRLCDSGLCRPVRGGYIVSAEALSRPELLAFMLRNHANLTRMFAGLGQAGVLALWDQARPGNGVGEVAHG
ncbi:helix-turn-helix transcriptional regulator [Phenylobacterium hankyongense]|uniref:helix-turn-helix transcriptional regulator n=1 Tax=Phenylobacterium hankyongense TaxID=1813876 RepID=UPI001057D7F7|nr:helix-turn-helix transcriptional regulator [Phenylobacterium hankyongense]